MDFSSLKHKNDSIYSFPISSDEIEIRLLTKANDDIKKVELIYNDKYLFHSGIKSVEMHKICSDGIYDYYIKQMKLVDKRFAYVFKITTLDDQEYYFSESGISDTYDISKGFYDFFQVPFINSLDVVHINQKMQNRVFYQIFIDRFYKDTSNENPRVNLKWGEEVNSLSIAGGTIKGIKQKLNYLVNLGINGLYLTPIFKSNSNHKYDTIDYYQISEDFGNSLEVHQLIKGAHENDIIVLLDGVFNHVSSDFEYFQDVIKFGKLSKYYNWFFINDDFIDLEKINYETFAHCKYLPRLNLNNKEVQDYVIDICKHYINEYQVDGYRLDVSDEIPHAFWIRLKAELLNIKPDIILLGENWHNAHSFLNSGLEFDSIMNYSFTKNVLDFVAYQTIDAMTFKNRLISNLFRYKTSVNYNLLNLLSSHDIDRFLEECHSNVERYLIGYAILFNYIGVPCIYYGDEIGIKGGYDPYNRACFIWYENKWDVKINKTIKELIKIHKNEKINELSISLEVKNDILYLYRHDENKEITLIVNLSNHNENIHIDGVELLSQNYIDNQLHPEGFVIIKEVKTYEK